MKESFEFQFVCCEKGVGLLDDIFAIVVALNKKVDRALSRLRQVSQKFAFSTPEPLEPGVLELDGGVCVNERLFS